MSKETTPGALQYGRLQPVDHARQELYVNVPAGTDMKQILKPEFWKHYVAVITPNTLLECVCEDGTWEASLRVMFVSQTGVEAEVRWSQTYAKQDRPPESPNHYIKWISPTKQFGVIHKESGTVVQDNFYPRKKAEKFMANL